MQSFGSEKRQSKISSLWKRMESAFSPTMGNVDLYGAQKASNDTRRDSLVSDATSIKDHLRELDFSFDGRYIWQPLYQIHMGYSYIYHFCVSCILCCAVVSCV